MNTYTAATGVSLLPIQSGMLYQYLLGLGMPGSGGYDIEQICIATDEGLQPDLLQRAWSETANRHAVLRTAFRWEGLAAPLQISQPKVTVPVELLDWRGAEVAVERERFLVADRQRGFDLRNAPLMRLTLAQLPNNRQELFFTFHHLLIDGRSFATVLHEAMVRYEAYCRGTDHVAESPRTCFFDYVAWQAGLSHQDSLDYFGQLLAGKQAATPLPLAEPSTRPLAASGYGAIVHVLAEPLRAKLHQHARATGTSVTNVLQAAWALLLARLTGDHDVIFGVTRSCRYQGREPVHVDTVGLFINTLPVRVAIDEHETVEDFLRRIRKAWLEQRGHEHVPLVEVLGRSDIPTGNPLFESLFVYDNRELNQQLRKQDPEWNRRHCTLHEQPSVPLTLTVYDGEQLEMHLLYDRRRFTERNANRLQGYLVRAIETLACAQRVAEVQVLPADEFQTIVHGWNDTARAFSDTLLIHHLFERQVDQQPAATAVVVGDTQTSYAELERRANQLANVLQQRGIGPGQFVGFCLPRGLDLLVAMLGIAKSGAAYVPIDPDYPADRIAFMLQDTRAVLLLVAGSAPTLLPTLVERAAPVLAINDPQILQAPDHRPSTQARATDVCYVIYTSGSTGKPKGVVLTHRAVVNTLEWVSREFQVGPGDRGLFVTSPCFDLSVYDVFGVLGAGATVVVATSDLLREPASLVNTLVTQAITLWDSAPAALQRLAPLFPSDGGRHLRLVMLSGDWIPLTLPDAVRRAFPAAVVKSLGGATEAAIWSNWYPVEQIDPAWNSIPYGRPIQNAQYYVLDARRQPVPAGVSGDLYIAGTCLAEGYLNRAELTAERFVPNPFRAGERMYMTGDLARYFDDGVMEFLGRADFQVKIRGYRVELGEVEAALLALPDIRDAVCTAFTDLSGAKALVAYLTAHPGHVIDQDAIKATLQRSLPDFMVPSRFMVLDAMPLSSNGKVDRKALPLPSADTAGAADIGVLTGETQQRMASVWQRLLKTDKLGPKSHFLQLGGDSLLAVSLALEIEKEFGRPFPLARIMASPTLGDMAALVEGVVSQRSTHLVTLNPNAPETTPLFLFSGGGGFGFFYHDLAAKLGTEQPVHVFNAIGADTDEECCPCSIEEMAAIYASEIETACPEGPLALGGYSFGAVLAYELARHLAAKGREISLLVSFDGPAPGYPHKLSLVPRMFKHVRDWVALSREARREYLRDRWTNVKQRFKPLENHPLLAPPPGIDERMAQRLRVLSANLAIARDHYQPKGPINCPVLLLKAEHPVEWPGHVLPEDYGWAGLAQRSVATVIVPGSHLTFFGDCNNALMARTIMQQLVPAMMR